MDKAYVITGLDVDLFLDTAQNHIWNLFIEEKEKINISIKKLDFYDEKINFLSKKLKTLRKEMYQYSSDNLVINHTRMPEEVFINYLREYEITYGRTTYLIENRCIFYYITNDRNLKFYINEEEEADKSKIIETLKITQKIDKRETVDIELEVVKMITYYLTEFQEVLDRENIRFEFLVNYLLYEYILDKYNNIKSIDYLYERFDDENTNLKSTRVLIVLNELNILSNLESKHEDKREISRKVASMLDTTESSINPALTAILNEYTSKNNPYNSKKNMQFAKELRNLFKKYSLNT